MEIVALLIFIALPLIEIALLISVGQAIGFWWTLAIVIATAIAGSFVLHQQGFAVLRRANTAMAEGRPPIEPVVDGVFLLLAGTLMITPGFLTDAMGLALLLPPVRRAIAAWALRRMLVVGGASSVVFGERRTWGARAKAGSDAHGAGSRGDGSRGDGSHEAGSHQGGARRRPETGASGGPIIEGEFERLDERPSPKSARPRSD